MRNAKEGYVDQKLPKVGVGVMILKDGKVLLAKRKGAHGAGEYAFPGGHLEFGESFEDCAIRETTEESGIQIGSVRFQYLANVRKYGKHYVHIGMLADWVSGEPEVLEPEKSETWGWYALGALPEPIFEMCKLSLDSYETGRTLYAD